MKSKKYISGDCAAQKEIVARRDFEFWPPVKYPTTREEWINSFPMQYAEEIYRHFKKLLAKAGYDYDDAIQEAMEVVVHCADHYCTGRRETKFSTYACKAIKNKYVDLIRRANSIKRPTELEELEEEYVTNEIDDDGDFSEEFEEATTAKIGGFASLEDRVFYKDMLRLLCSKLNEDERYLLQEMINGTKQEIVGKKLGVSQCCISGRVRNLRAKCIGILTQEKYKEAM